MRPSLPFALCVMLGATPASAQGNLLEQGRNLLSPGQPQAPRPSSPAGAAGVSSTQADSGLREALKVATQRTVSTVGKTDGYYKDPAIKIPLPGFLASARQGLALAGASGMLDDLELRMNRAAEAAAPKATAIFADAISRITITDAQAIVAGPNDAATQYFKRTTTQPLTTAFRPIIDRSLADAGAVQAYKAATQRAGGSLGGGALGGVLGGATGGAGGGAAGFDLADFVVEKALAGLFHYIGREEAAIRTNPAARSTELLKQVFGR